MSAIIGIFQRIGKGSLDGSLSTGMNALKDYGPGGSRAWVEPPLGLGHLGMSPALNDPEALPYQDPSSKLVITADLRLDNREELCRELSLRGKEAVQTPDSRLLLLAWQKWGRDCPQHLNGDYAFVIWNPAERSLFCARDHIGVKPFYYSLTPRKFIFASDIEGILAFPGVSNQLDDDYVIGSLSNPTFFIKDRTYFTSIRKLAPGHTMTVTPANVSIERSWFPEDVPDVRFKNDSDYAEAAREIFTNAVHDRMRTNREIGVHLSGGLDCSSVAVMAARERRRRALSPPKVFSWQPQPEKDNESSDEYTSIESICRIEGLTPQFCSVGADDYLRDLGKDPAREPIDSTVHVERAVQKKAAAQGVCLILSGWGGDEGLSFSGRGYYSDLLIRGKIRQLYRDFKWHGSPLKLIGMEALLLLFQDRYQGMRILQSRSFRAVSNLKSFVAPGFRRIVGIPTPPCRQSSVRQTMLWLLRSGLHTRRIESWAASGAKHQISYAYPFLDRRLLEFVAGLPPEQFIRGKWNRWIMRNTMEGILPDRVRWAGKGSEPVRLKRFKSTQIQALEKLQMRLSKHSDSYPRARYLNMPRLIKSLHPENLAKRSGRANVHALQFLDF